MKKLTKKQVEIIKEVFSKEPSKKFLAVQGHVSTLMDLSYMIGENTNYSIVSKNLKQVI